MTEAVKGDDNIAEVRFGCGVIRALGRVEIHAARANKHLGFRKATFCGTISRSENAFFAFKLSPYYLPWNDQAFQESRCAEHSTRLHVEKPTDEVASSPSELRLPACGETAAKLISVGGRRFKRLPAAGEDVEHATIAAVVRGI